MNRKKPKELLDYESAAVYLRLKKSTLYAKVSRHEVPFIRLSGRLVRFDRAQLDAWLDQRSVPPAVANGSGQ